MSHVIRIVIISVAALAALSSSQSVAAAEEGSAGTAATTLPAESMAAPVVAKPLLLGIKPVDAKVLARKRGGADVVNDMQLKGVVADNRAINVTTGSNLITEGAFANSAGLPMVVQNSGNNVLIQNATIVNVQVK